MGHGPHATHGFFALMQILFFCSQLSLVHQAECAQTRTKAAIITASRTPCAVANL